jgi:isoleucyl-tRNA synthetase
LPSAETADLTESDWALIASARNAVNKVLEGKKEQGIQKSLEAEVTLFADTELHAALSKLGDELRFVLITSDATLKPMSNSEGGEPTELEGLRVIVEKTVYAKCDRCWHHRKDVGSHAEYPELCSRCIENISGAGEQRLYA